MKKVILDCDPGHDDAIMIFMALASKDIKVMGITTSAGNQVPEKTFLNARKLLALAEREDIPVARGASKPLRRDLIIADYVHGESGLDGADLPEPTVPYSDQKALDLWADILRDSQEKVTIVATGPLTNVAIFLLAYPELKEKIELISFMGGACFGGNYTANAEFNIYVDPEACDIVLNAGVPLAMFGLDVTLKAQLYDEDIEKLKTYHTKTGDIMYGLLKFYGKTTSLPFLAEEGHVEGLHMHDPCAIAYVSNPELFTMVPMRVDVVTQDGHALGCTVCDYHNDTGKKPNALVGFGVDRTAFSELLLTSLSKFN